MQELKRFSDKPKGQTTNEWVELAEATIDSYFNKLRAAQHGVKWLPIETAPKDGKTAVLVWNKECGCWIAAFRQPRPRDLYCNTHCKKEWRDDQGRWETPTHWMQLPPPPAV